MKAAISFAAAVLAASPAVFAGQFTSMIDFGDSLSDVGNDYNSSFHLAPGSPGYYDGRFSNGPIWLEKLGPDLGLPVPTASTAGGNDFAYGGVTSGTGNTTESILSFPNVETQINSWTASHTATSTQLFTVLGGANDLFNLLDGSGTTTAQQAADNIAAGVTTLYSHGARTILVGDLPDIGQTPAYHNTAEQSQATALAQAFNTELTMDLANLSATATGLTIDKLDLYSLFNLAIASPSTYGFTDVRDSAYTGDTTFAGNGTAVANPSGYLFWDDVHPTTTGHAFIAQAAFAAVSPVPEPASVSMIAACVGLAMRRRNRRVG